MAVHCPECGFVNAEGANYCSRCGAFIGQPEPTGSVQSTTATYMLDEQTGEKLWSFQCGSGHHSSPTPYSVDGRQYIAVPTGWGGWVEGFFPGFLGANAGDALFVFALPED